MLMGPHDGAVDHQPFQIGFACQRHQHGVEHPHLDPAVVASLHRAVIAKSLGQIAPACAGAGHPQQGIQKPPVVRARPPLAFGPPRHKSLDPLPLIIRQPVDIHR
jgi:hypothetical protein